MTDGEPEQKVRESEVVLTSVADGPVIEDDRHPFSTAEVNWRISARLLTTDAEAAGVGVLSQSG